MGKPGIISKAYDTLVGKAKETGAAVLSAAPAIKEYIPSDWESSPPVEDPTLKIAFMVAVPVVSYLALDAAAAYKIARAGPDKQSKISTVGPISAITRKVKYGEYFRDIEHCPMCGITADTK